MSIEIAERQTVPKGLLEALDRWEGDYTPARYLYECMNVDAGVYVGVFGDGKNGAYEWLIWDSYRHVLRTSNCAYGSIHAALRHGLERHESAALSE